MTLASPRLERVNHVHITVPMGGLDVARGFYCDIIGLTEVEKPEELKVYPGFWCQLDGLQLHIGEEDGDHDRYSSGAHTSIQVEDLDVRRARLEAAGIRIKEMVYYPGFVRFEFRDPFGNRMELIQAEREGAR